MSDATRQDAQVPVPIEAHGEPVQRDYYYPAYSPAPAGPEGADWSHIARLLWQGKWWILVALALGTAAGHVGSRLVAPVYQASTTVWVEAPETRGGAIRAGEVLGGEGWASIYNSYAVMVPVAERERLYLRTLLPKDAPAAPLSDFELLNDLVPGVYEYRVTASGDWTLSRPGDGVVERGRAGEPVGLAAGFRWNPPADAVKPESVVRFRVMTPRGAALRVWNNLKVRYDPRSSLIYASLTWENPVEAAEILNALNRKFIEVATELKSRKMREEVEILEEQTQYVAQQLEAAELALESHRISTVTLPTENNVVALPGTQALANPVFGAYFEKRVAASQLDQDIRQLDAMLAELRAGNTPNLTSLGFIPTVANASDLTGAIEDLQRKEVERRTLLYRYTEEWPDVQRLSEEIRLLKTQMMPALMQQLVEQLRTQRTAVDQQIAAQASELRQIPSRTIEEARRTREAQLHSQLYNDLKVRLNNARLAQATAELADMRVVDEAVPARAPLRDQGPRILLLASVAGLGLGIAGVLVRDKLDRRIRHPGQVTGTLGLPVLGVVPRLNGRKDASPARTAVVIEAFRGIRTQLARALGAEGKLTMVTSPAPREGKSMVAANLAISYASAGYRTVLLDGDTRRGRAHEMFGLQKSPGLADYLTERASLDDTLQETGVDGLWLIARGSLEEFNADRLDSELMDQLLVVLGESYDAVVIDAPPLAAGADALLLGERADKVLLVVRAGTTNEDLCRTKLEMVGNVELHIVGTVLNAVPENAPYYDQYVSYYYAEAEITG